MDKLILVGFQGSGKNTVGEYLVEKHGYVGISFADALKDSVASIFCWDRDALEGNTPESRLWRETVDQWWADKLGIPEFTPRWALRHFGTDIMRSYFHTDVWINNVEKRIRDLGDKRVVVFDGRFPNEIDLVTKVFNGTSIRVKRGDEPKWWDIALAANSHDNKAITELKALGVHTSEYAWIGHKIGITIENNDSVDNLYATVDRVVTARRRSLPQNVLDLLEGTER